MDICCNVDLGAFLIIKGSKLLDEITFFIALRRSGRSGCPGPVSWASNISWQKKAVVMVVTAPNSLLITRVVIMKTDCFTVLTKNSYQYIL